MADIPTPPKKKAQKAGAPPAKDAPMIQNLKQPAEKELHNLSFKLSPEFKKEYKLYAAERGMTMLEVLQESFKLYKERYPSV